MTPEQLEIAEKIYSRFWQINNEKGFTSFKVMCEHIVAADILENEDGTKVTAEEVFGYSSSGELYMVYQWYMEAVSVIGFPDNTLLPEDFFDEFKM